MCARLKVLNFKSSISFLKVGKLGKKKTKVWVDVDKVIIASTIPKKLRWYEQLLIEVPKGEKASNK